MLLAEHALVGRADQSRRRTPTTTRAGAGSRELMQWDMEVLPRDGALLRSVAADSPRTRRSPRSWLPFVPPAPRRRSSATAWASTSPRTSPGWTPRWPTFRSRPTRTTWTARAGTSFPYGHPACFVCGTCKRERVRVHGAGGRVVVFVGDGQSDRYAAHHADVVWAKKALLGMGPGHRPRLPCRESRRSRPGSGPRSPTAGSRRPPPTWPAWRATHRPLRPDARPRRLPAGRPQPHGRGRGRCSGP